MTLITVIFSGFLMKNEKLSIQLNCWSWLDGIRESASKVAPNTDRFHHRHLQHRSPPWAASRAITNSNLMPKYKEFLEFHLVVWKNVVKISLKYSIKILEWVQMNDLTDYDLVQRMQMKVFRDVITIFIVPFSKRIIFSKSWVSWTYHPPFTGVYSS